MLTRQIIPRPSGIPWRVYMIRRPLAPGAFSERRVFSRCVPAGLSYVVDKC